MGAISGIKNLGCLLAAGLLGLFFLAAAAGTSSARSYNVMNVSPQIASDNHRYVSFQKRNRVPFVLDTFTGRLRRINGARSCHPRDIGGGRVLMICPHFRPTRKDTGFRAKIASVHGGQAVRLARSGDLDDAYEIGKYWVEVNYLNGPDTPAYYYVNWRKGYITGVYPEHLYLGRDLDSRKLKVNKEIANFDPRPPGFNPKRDELKTCRGDAVVVTEWRKQMRLFYSATDSVQLGKAGSIRYYECEWYQSIRIGPERVTWSNGPTVHAFNYLTGQRFSRRFGKPGARITPVRDGVVVAKKIKDISRFRHHFRIKLIRFG